MKRNALLREAWDRLIKNHSFVLACHQNPDGDTLGSALALAHVLRGFEKDVTVLCEGGLSDNYSFIPEQDTVVQRTRRRGFDVGMLVDCEGLRRAGTAGKAVSSSRVTACIDHHVPDDEFGDIRIVDQYASSTAELVVRLLDANDVPIDQIAAQQLMAGLVNDTGGFRFPNTTAETFRVAARLVDLGASPAFIAREIYETRPFRALKLLGRALESLEADAEGRVVWATVRRDDLKAFQATDSDTDSIVNYVGFAKGAKVAILFRELGRRHVRASLRSREDFDVNRVARAFDGGGHAAAAGCTLRMPLQKAKAALITEVLKWMEC